MPGEPQHIQKLREPISVSSDVLARLGEELITNHVQALAELVKNAYDADATVVRVDVDTTKALRDPEGRVRRGIITIADNGFGMDEDRIRGGWLRVSASPKRAMKERGEKTPRKRTPLGDKGLGRLGAQRLGDRVRIRTRPQLTVEDMASTAFVEHDVAFAFSDFRTETDVNEIRVPWTIYDETALENTEPWPMRKATGTIIEVTGLSSVADWEEVQELERALSLLVNPFKGLEQFSLSVTVDGLPLNLHSVASEVRDAALSRWQGTFDGETLSVEGAVRLQWFSARDKDDRALLERLVDADRGAGLRDHVLASAADQPFEASAGDGPWLLTFRWEGTLDRLDETGLDLEQLGDDFSDPVSTVTDEPEPALPTVRLRPVDPGEFLFELDVVSRRLGVARSTGAGLSALNKQAEYSRWLNDRGGMHIYRDGFRINLGDDFMALGEAFTSSSSYYGLRPQNVIGYVEISAEHNPGLQETTDREGFRETPEVRSFRLLVKTVRDEVNRVLNVVGRATGTYLRSQSTPDDDTTEELAGELEDVAAEAGRARVVTVAAQQQVSRSLAADTRMQDGSDQRAALEAAQTALETADAALARVSKAHDLGRVVRRDVAELGERVDDFAQLIGLGLVAETMAHELTNVSGRLHGQVADLRTRSGALEPWARAYLSETESALDALRGQLRHLDPMLRYARSRREDIDLGEFADDMAAFHAERLQRKRIEVAVIKDRPAVVRANRGRLMQVFDNLVINAEYWLDQALRAGRLATGHITVEVAGPSLSFRDNGPGFDDKLAATVFEPFVTAKSDGGRGLGLFIARQLLELDGGTIHLADSRNASNRPDTVEIEFSSQP